MAVHANLTVNISVGNDAVQTAADVAELLRTAAADLERTTLHAVEGVSLRVFDINGNRVGTVQVTGFRDDDH